MLLTISNCLLKPFRSRATPAFQFVKIPQRWRSMFEPDFLDTKPEVPLYGTLIIKLQGYDFVPLESFAKYVNRKCKRLGLDSLCYPVPARMCDVQVIKPGTIQINKVFNLSMYERIVKIEDVPSTLAPVLFEVLHTNLPPAVQLTVDWPNEEEEDFRYVPDLALGELQAEVTKIEKAKEDRKKK